MAVARYQLVAPLAKGGMGEIWLARQPGVKQFDRVVVIKRLINSLESDHDSVEMFLTEARLAAQLSHPNVVQIFELGEHQGSFFIAMEYVDGENLATVRAVAGLSNHPIPLPFAARVAAMAAEGMHYAHTRTSYDGRPLSIIHRDVSPQNLIVTYEGGLKLVDFGVAKVASEATTSGKLKGKIRYMSPEQARGEPTDERADIFSLGMVLFELATNSRMYAGVDELQLLREVIAAEPLIDARARRPEIPLGLSAIIARALERDRERRFPNARAMQAALEEFLRSEGLTSGSAELSSYMKTLFKDRIAERRRLLESAMAGEINPSLVPAAFEAPTGGQTGRRRRLALGAALIVLAGFSVGLFAGKPTAAPQPPPVAAHASTPLPTAPILDIDTDPSGAALEIDAAARGAAPASLEGLAPGEHQITATLAGFLPATRLVTLQAGERVRLVMPLNPVPAAAAPPVATAAAAPAAVPARRKGKLNLSTKPWTMVYLGKAKLGETPLTELALPAGRHLLRLVNPEKQLETTIVVEIRAGETTTKKLQL